jgi:hypothetical protein
MQELILSYLATHQQLSIKDIGVFTKQKIEPIWLATQQQFEQPKVEIQFNNIADATSTDFIIYIANKKQITSEKALAEIELLKNNSIIEIEGLGTLTKVNDQFVFENKQQEAMLQIDAKRAIHQQPHLIKIGEDYKSNVEMKEYFDNEIEATPKWKWWYNAIVLAVCSIGYIVYYFLTHSRLV